MNYCYIALMFLAISQGMEHDTVASEPRYEPESVHETVPPAGDALAPPYDVFRHRPTALYPVSQLETRLPRDGSIDFDKLPRRPDGLPYVVRLMWGTCITPGCSCPSFSCVWSDGTITHKMPRTEVPAEPLYDLKSYELRFILNPDAETAGNQRLQRSP